MLTGSEIVGGYVSTEVLHMDDAERGLQVSWAVYTEYNSSVQSQHVYTALTQFLNRSSPLCADIWYSAFNLLEKSTKNGNAQASVLIKHSQDK